MSRITIHNTKLCEYIQIHATPKIVSTARCSALSECWASVLVHLITFFMLGGAADICSTFVTMNCFGICMLVLLADSNLFCLRL